LRVSALLPRVMEPGQVWMTLNDAKAAAIPAPVRRILESLVTAS